MKMKVEGIRALVVGMEKSGRAAFEFLHARGAEVTATDLKPQSVAGFRLQSDELFDEEWDLIVLSPGVPLDVPGLARAKARGITVIGEVELAAPYLQGPVVGITGSNGKTTTTSLVGHIFRSSRTPVQVGGNIGTPVIALTATSRPDQWNVLELSSFQLETIETFRADVAVCLNVTQNHLDRHHTFANYTAAKANLFRTQKEGDFAVLNADDEICRSYADITAARTVWFRGSEIGQLMPPAEVPIPGAHNAENVMAAAAVAEIAGISKVQIVAAVKTFQAVEHRLEFVRELGGVRFYNDSKATSVDATMKALDSFPGNLWVILGGKDKGSDYTVLRERLRGKARAALLIGAASAKIEADIAGSTTVIRAETLENAVAVASKNAASGDTVLLAPACASFDQFQSYEHRGRAFKDLVNGLVTTHGATS
ncbi:MAG TPA: UDP-N-acetylmuramoyl-L-alanine--D-glutamate ligase [Bryobacteraceae bacterium]|jgi:UDP-N-acetylmuramoylalanine--D-glutamate ligase|nr:UDP-N-acetylmuramoyl-L-alanine--D-glutamate ligase [Bryobacteraceae bacterium]